MDIRLRPLRDDEFPAFRERLRVEYVRGLVADAHMARGSAETKASADHESLFAGGKPQPNHRIRVVEDTAGDEVGHVFWARRRPPDASRDHAYLYDLYIAERFRGHGLGKRALELLEVEAREEGLDTIDLNVWGGNEAARGLYRAAGFDERAVFMTKELA